MAYKFFVVGAGEGGCRIADEFYGRGYCSNAVAINTSKPDLDGLKNIPVKTNQLEIRPPTGLAGAGKNPAVGEQAARIAQDVIADFMKKGLKAGDGNFILLTVGGGGGTGTGLAVPLVEIANQLEVPVGMIYTLPSKKDGTVTQINAMEILKTLYSLASTGKVAPFILVDNEKMLAGTKGTIVNYWNEVNKRIVTPLHLINQYTDKASKFFSAVDTADLGTILLTNGCCAINTFKISAFNNMIPILDALHSSYFIDGFELDTAKAAGFIVTGTEETLNKPEVRVVYDALETEIAQRIGGGLIYKGLYEEETLKDSIRIITIFNGMTLPMSKIDSLMQDVQKGMSTIEAKENRISSFNFSFESKGAFKTGGMDRLSKTFKKKEEGKK